MRPDTIKVAIEEKYTPEEKLALAQNMATNQADLEAVEAEKKVSDSNYNARIKGHYEELSKLAKRFNKGCELREVTCDIRYDDPETGQKTYRRMDSGEAVQTLEMSWEEKQQDLQFNLPAEAPAGDAPAPPDDLEKAMGMSADSTPSDPPAPAPEDPPVDWKIKPPEDHEGPPLQPEA